MNIFIRNSVHALVAATLLVVQTMSSAAPTAQTLPKVSVSPRLGSAAVQPQIFTIRYVFFTAMPQQRDAEAVKQMAPQLPLLPQAFQEMQEGSDLAMTTTPMGFLTNLKAAEQNHSFRLILSGSVTCLNHGSTIIDSGISPSDPRKFCITDQFTLVQTSPNHLLTHQTGAYAYTPLGQTGRDVTSWNDGMRPNVIVGATYSQGIDMMPDGEKLVYAFCILPGVLDQTAPAWKSNKDEATLTARHDETDRRVAQ